MEKGNQETRSYDKGFSSTTGRVLIGAFVLTLMTGASCARKPVAAADATSGAATTERSPTATAAVSSVTVTGSFGPTVPNTAPAPRAALPRMVWIPGGEFSMGAADSPGEGDVGMQGTRDSRPIHRVYVDGFFMDQTDVTNAEFAQFVKATGYV